MFVLQLIHTKLTILLTLNSAFKAIWINSKGITEGFNGHLRYENCSYCNFLSCSTSDRRCRRETGQRYW